MSLRKKYVSARTGADVPAMLQFVCRETPNLDEEELRRVASIVVNNPASKDAYRTTPKGMLVTLNNLDPDQLVNIYEYLQTVIYKDSQ